MWVLCAASLPLDRLRHPAARARRVLPDLAATAGRARLSQRDRRLRGARGARARSGSRAPRSAPGASAGCGTLALLVLGLALASSRGGVLAAVIGCGVWLAVSDRRTESGAALLAVLVGERAGGALGARPALLQGARRALHRARRLAPGLVLGRGRAGGGGARPARRGARAARRPARAPGLRPRRRWPSPWSALCSRPCGSRRSTAAPVGALSHVWHQLSGGGAVGSTDHLDAALDQPARPLVGRGLGRLHRAPVARQRRRHVRDDRPPGAARLPAGRPGALRVPARALGHGAAGRASRRRSRWRPPAPAWPPSRACAAASAPPRSRSRPASAPSRCTTRSTGSGSRPRSRVLAYPIPVLIACAAGGGVAVARRPPRRRPRGAGGGGLRARRDPRDAARAEQPRARRAPTGSRARAALDEARVEADLAAALDRTSVDAQLERASLLQRSAGPPTRGAPSTTRSRSRAEDDRSWLTLAGYQRWCWNDPRLAREPRTARARCRATTRVFAGTDARGRSRASDACTEPASGAGRALGAEDDDELRALRPATGVMPSNGVTNCTLPTSLASLRAAGP